MMWGYDWMPFGGIVMGLLMIAFWALVIFGIVWLVRQFSGRPTTPDAKRILDRRFAAGEIDEDEYRRRLAALTSDPRRDAAA